MPCFFLAHRSGDVIINRNIFEGLNEHKHAYETTNNSDNIPLLHWFPENKVAQEWGHQRVSEEDAESLGERSEFKGDKEEYI